MSNGADATVIEVASRIPALLEQAWTRRTPVRLEHAVSRFPLLGATPERLLGSCGTGVEGLLFTVDGRHGEAATRLVQRVAEPDQLASAFEAASDTLVDASLMVNRLEDALPVVVPLREAVLPAFGWLRQRTYGMVSTPRGGVGHHADAFNIVIVQLGGSKGWRVWAPDLLPPFYRRALARRTLSATNRAVAPPIGRAVLEVTLEPGDVLFLPAHFGHEAIAVDEPSVSLSMLWQAWTVRDALVAILGGTATVDALLPDEVADRLLEDDPKDPVAAYLAQLGGPAEIVELAPGRLAAGIARLMEAGASGGRSGETPGRAAHLK